MLQDFKNSHKGETCLIIGNGLSLDDTPLERLNYPSFGSNKIYDLPYKPDFWACCDRDMLHDTVPWLFANPEYRPEIFLPRDIPFPGSHGLNVTIGTPFSTDAANFVTLGGTITFVHMQLAYYMGFRTILCVGLDHSYPKSGEGVPGSKFIAAGDDPDHFKGKAGKPYFEPGKIYNRPELDGVAKYSYPAARANFESAGGRILNLSTRTALSPQVLEKDDIYKWFR